MQNLRGEAECAVAAAFAPRRPDSQSRRPAHAAGLQSFVENEIAPRLLRAHPPALPARPSAAAALETLMAALLACDAEAARNAFERAGVDAPSQSWLMLELLAPAARRLGVLWEEDSCDFFDVSRALDLLRGLLSSLDPADPPRRRDAPAMLLLTAPGETHLFGADMAAELFRRQGWQVERGDASRLFRLSERRFAALGISCACERFRGALTPFLAEARARAKPHLTAIGLGGALFAANPDLIRELGADFAAPGPDSPRRVSPALLEPARL